MEPDSKVLDVESVSEIEMDACVALLKIFGADENSIILDENSSEKSEKNQEKNVEKIQRPRRKKVEMDRLTSEDKLALKRANNREAAARYAKRKWEIVAEKTRKLENLQLELIEIRGENRILKAKNGGKFPDFENVKLSFEEDERIQLEENIASLQSEICDIVHRTKVSNRSLSSNTLSSQKFRANQKLKVVTLDLEILELKAEIQRENEIRRILATKTADPGLVSFKMDKIGAILVEEKPLKIDENSEKLLIPKIKKEEEDGEYDILQSEVVLEEEIC